ncbi:hypothetical protein [Streptomyces sp. S1]|uniref:hypothetical protein n=1 Tax=Streptomyces sp. S1 TaxID=718288 RepID=UPI003D7261A7
MNADAYDTAVRFVDTWSESVPDIASGLTCREVDALVELFCAFNRDELADQLIAAHVAEDTDPVDLHYQNETA